MVMKKIKLYGTGNLGDFNFYIFDKSRKVQKILSELLRDLFKIDWGETRSIEGSTIDEKKSYFNIKRNSDFFQYISDKVKKLVIGVFYGDKRMFVTFLGPNSLRLKLNRQLEKIAVMPKFVR